MLTTIIAAVAMKRTLVRAWRKKGGPTRLRALRLARGLTLDELAQRASVNKSTLSKLEKPNGDQNPTFDLLEAVGQALGVPSEEIYETDERKSRSAPSTPVTLAFELFLRDTAPSAATVKKFRWVAEHQSPPATVPEWQRFVDWLSLFTGRRSRGLGRRPQETARVRPFTRR